MKNFRILISVLALTALASCSDNTRIKGVLTDAPDRQIVVKQLAVNAYDVLDTIKTGKDGSFSYKMSLTGGHPEFVYLFDGDTRVAALLLEKGEAASVVADTLGNYTVSGSEGSEKLKQVEDSYTAFIRGMASTEDPAILGKLYVGHYRECVKYVMQNPFSLTVVPVLFEKVNNLAVFSQPSDAVIFRSACDSLKTVYPDSRYVKALDKEAGRRESELKLSYMIQGAEQLSYPDIIAPDMNGEKVALSSLDSKVVLVHFWNADEAAEKMFNREVLLPLYEDFHGRGLEIYSVCVSPDKAQWGSVVKAQSLPWVNVNDGRGAASPSVISYNIYSTPTTFIIADGEIITESISGEAQLRAKLNSLLR